MFDKKELEKYQLRKAAGKYWLLDMEQDIDDYKQPIPLNEVGARIWELLTLEKDIDEISEILTEEYEVDRNIIKEDTEEFINQLYEIGILSKK